jgi:hypothetical protein
VFGVVAVAAGTYLPWLETGKSTYQSLIPPHLPGMDHGFEAMDAVLLFGTGVALLATFVVSRRRRRAVLSVLVGAGVLVVCTAYLDAWAVWNEQAAPPGVDFFPPEPTDGFLLTVLGGLLILCGGIADVTDLGYRRLRERFTTG